VRYNNHLGRREAAKRPLLLWTLTTAIIVKIIIATTLMMITMAQCRSGSGRLREAIT
jgi:hypothetical protein